MPIFRDKGEEEQLKEEDSKVKDRVAANGFMKLHKGSAGWILLHSGILNRQVGLSSKMTARIERRHNAQPLIKARRRSRSSEDAGSVSIAVPEYYEI